MEIVRLKVKILAWQNPASIPQSALSRQNDIKTWIEPCAADLTISALHERIVESFADLHGGKGELNIKWLEDDDGNVLRGHLKVGDTFKESRDISDRTVKVVRLPPRESDLSNPGRFSSIAPDSSARPFKRALNLHAQSVRNNLRDLINAEDWSVRGPQDNQERAAKRQRVDDARFEEDHEYDRPMLSSEGVEEQNYHTSTQTGRQGSPVHQVDDSQRSPGRTHRNPYDTPTSLSVYSPLNAFSSSQNGVIAIPDSPERGTTAYSQGDPCALYDGYKAKSESPELAPSILDLPSGAPASVRNAGIQAQVSDDPIFSSLPGVDPVGHDKNVIYDQLLAIAPLSELQKRKKSPERRLRSPFLDYSPSQEVSSTKGYFVDRLQKPSSKLNDASQIGEKSVQAQKDTLLPSPPIQVAVSGVIMSPSQSGGAVHEDHPGGPSIIDMQEESSTIGPTILTGSDRTSRAPDERQSPARRPPPDRTSYVVPPSEIEDRQMTPKFTNGSHVVDGLTDEIVTSSYESDPRTDKARYSNQRIKAALHEAPDHEMGPPAVASMSKAEHDPNEPEGTTLDVHDTPMMSLKKSVTYGNKRGGTASLRETIVNRVGNGGRPKFQDRNATNRGAEIISIDETEDESLAAKPGPLNREAAGKPDVWSVPSDSDQETMTRSNRKPTRSPGLGEDRKSVTGRKTKTSNATPLRRDSAELAKKQKEEQVAVLEQQRLDQEKRDKINARRREIAAKKKAEESRWTEKPKANSEQAREDQRYSETRETPVLEQSQAAHTARRKTPIAHSLQHERSKNPSVPESTRSEGEASLKKAPQDNGPDQEKSQKAKDAGKRKVPEVRTSENGAAKKTKVKGDEAVESTKLAENQNVKEEMAAREADAIAHAQRSIKLPSVKPSTESRKSSTPGPRKDAASKRRSMTPLFPSSTASKPVKSALRSSENFGRRSVSFNEDALAHSSPTLMVTKAVKPLGNLSSQHGAEAGLQTIDLQNVESRSSPSQRALNRRENVPSASGSVSKSNSSKPVTPSSEARAKPKIQTKLNVTRDVKLKGRAIEPPPPPRPVTLAKDGKIVISSDSEKSASTFYSDEEDRVRPAKAGPSSRKKLSSSIKSDKEAATTRNTPTVDGATNSSAPRFANSTIGGEEPPAIMAAKDHGLERNLRDMSTSRSPAQYMSQAETASSQSRSDTESQAASESEPKSEDESEEGSGSDYKSEIENEAPIHSTLERNGMSKVQAVQAKNYGSQKRVDKSSVIENPSKAPLSKRISPQRPPSTSEESSTGEEEEDLAQQMEQQLQRDCRRSMEPQAGKQPVLPSRKPIAPNTYLAQSRASEPPKTRFPSLSSLKSRAPKQIAKPTTAQQLGSAPVSEGNRTLTAQPPRSGTMQDSRSSSESDDESSSEDSDGDATASQPNQGGVGKAATKPSSTWRPMSRILKVAKMLPG